MTNELAIGVDLGTYNSSAAVALNRDRIIMVRSKEGPTPFGKDFPSFVMFDDAGEPCAVGQNARALLHLKPRQVVWGVKRLVGLSYDTAKERGELDRFRYNIVRGPQDGILIEVGGKHYTPEQVLGLILREIRRASEDSSLNPLLGGPCGKAVVSVPAYFRAFRTGPVVEAAREAGFSEVETIAEPAAAALRYGTRLENECTILAFDLGAGTLDVTILQVVLDGASLITGELCSSGHENLGGIDMDDMLLDHVISEAGLGDVRRDPGVFSTLRDEVERAKILLSQGDSVQVDAPGGVSYTLTRQELEDVLAPLLKRCRSPIHTALLQAGIRASELDHVVLIGGPIHMPCVKKAVAAALKEAGARPELLEGIVDGPADGSSVDPMECVSQGAALKAARVAEPVVSQIAEGYGIVFGSYYKAIIPAGSSYPVRGQGGLIHSNVSTKHVGVPLVCKCPDPDNSSRTQTVYRYEHLGEFTLSIRPTGEPPVVGVQLEVAADRQLRAILTHQQTGQQSHLFTP